jgi:hypothetical protein
VREAVAGVGEGFGAAVGKRIIHCSYFITSAALVVFNSTWHAVLLVGLWAVILLAVTCPAFLRGIL